MYKINSAGLKEWTLDMKSFVPEFVKKCESLDINPREIKLKFYSQQDEDKYIIQYLLKDIQQF